MSDKSVLVFTATYNEKSNILEFSNTVINVLPDCDLLIIDDNSTDGTVDILNKLKQKYAGISVINRPRKMGLGSAHKLAMMYAKKNKYDTLVTMDADLSHDPHDIPRLLDALKESDMVIGSRYMKGGTCDYTGYRKYVSMIANWFTRRLLGIPLHEFTTSFRAFRVSIFENINFGKIRSQGYSFFLESIFIISRYKLILSEVPIHFRDRKAGSSKIPKFEIFNGIYNLLYIFILKLFKRNIKSATVDMYSTCYLCGSSYLIELFPKREAKGNRDKSYNCTSMEHNSNPQIMNCLCCGLSYVPENLHDKPLKDVYSNVVDDVYLENKDARNKTFHEVYEKISPYIKKTGKLLEVGAYYGLFLNIARDKGMNVVGVEPSIIAAKYAREALHLDVREGMLDDNVHMLGKDFDVIVLWDVLEHLSDPLLTLKQVHSLLKKDGVLCFSTLDLDNWFPKLTGSRWPWIMDMHLFYFTRQVLEQFIARAGFTVISYQNYCHYASVRYLIDKMQVLLPWKIGKAIAIFKPLLPKDIFIPFRFGDIKFFICKKI